MPDLVERVVAAMYNDPTDVRTATKRGIAIALEEAAKVAAAQTDEYPIDDFDRGINCGIRVAAAAIRAMIPSGNDPAQDDPGSAE